MTKLISNLAPLDRAALEKFHIPGLRLMEAAGAHVAEAVLERLKERGLPPKNARVVILTGRGNNGGDGLVAARHLAQKEVQVVVLARATAETLTGDALENFNRLASLPVQVLPLETLELLEPTLCEAHIVVDALFGSGLTRPIEGVDRQVIGILNTQRAVAGFWVVSVDLPSGVDGATGEIQGIAVEADETVTFAVPKPGLYLYPGRSVSGRVQVVDIGLPQSLIDQDPSPSRLLTPALIHAWLPERPADSHKYTFGHGLVIAGSRTMPGAAALCSEAVLTAGAGMVTLAAPDSVFLRASVRAEVLQLPLSETADGTLGPESWPAVEARLRQGKIQTVALGPGLGTSEATLGFLEPCLRFLCQEFQGTVVLDADGLNGLSQLVEQDRIQTLNERFVLTPHGGEAQRLWDRDVDLSGSLLLEAAQELAGRFQATVVLKSAAPLIATEGQVWFSPTGNSGMATAGSGDVLTGIITGLAAQGLSPGRAAQVGTYLHGLAGDCAAEALTPWAMTAGDLSSFLSEAFLRLIHEVPNP